MSLFARPEIAGLEHTTSPPASATPAPKPHVRRWVSFAFGADGTGPATRSEGPALDELGRYRLEAIQAVRGLPPTGLGPGLFVTRREQEGIRAPLSTGPALSGVAELGRSTPETTEQALLRSWTGSPWRVGLLLVFSHGAPFWALPAEQRGGTYLGLHEAPRPVRGKIMDRVLRRLFRVRSSSTSSTAAPEWDYLAFFEMQPRDVAYVREHLAELRDRRANALFNHVTRETELWMTRQPSSRS